MKNTLLFTYCTNILVRLLTVNMNNSLPQKSENVRPHSNNYLKMQPHYSQPSRENATPSNGTSPLASYNEVPPPPPGGMTFTEILNTCGR